MFDVKKLKEYNFFACWFVLQILVFLAAPEVMSTGFIFVRIRGGFHEIRNSVWMLFVDYGLI